MAIKDLKKFLDTECPITEIKYMDDEAKKGAYIPIGIVEQNLDEFDNWDTQNWQFMLLKVDRNWVASGSVELIVQHGERTIKRSGSATFPVSSKSNNEDFESTALSLATANAAKKLGKRFGRHLNGRLEIGEKIPTIDLAEQRKLDAAIDEIHECSTMEQAIATFEKYPNYQKQREFTVAFSNQKGIIKIKEANGTKLPNT